MRKFPEYFLYTCLFAFVLLLPISKTADADIFFHLRLGELIFSERALPVYDTLSYTAEGQRLYLGDWLSNLILYIIYHGEGWHGLMLLKVVSFALIMFTVSRTCRLFGQKHPVLLAIAVVLIALSMRFRLNLRPYYFSFLFFSIFLYLLMKHQKEASPRLLYLLPIIQVLWANTHGGAIMGPVLTFLYYITETIRKKTIDRHLTAVLLLVIVAGGLSPEGFGPYSLLYSFIPLKTAGEGGGFSIGQIDEWTALTPWMLWGHGIRYTWAFQVLAVGAFIYLLLRVILRDINIFLLLLFCGSVFYSIRHVRLIDLSSIALGPIFYGFLLTISGAIRAERWPPWLKAGGTVLVSVLIAVLGYYSVFKSPVYTFGVGPKERVFPEGAVEFLRQNNISGRGFNTIPAGSYLLFVAQERKVFIDGRLSYPGEFITTYFHSLKSPETFAVLDEKYDFQYAIAEYGVKPSWKFPFHLNENPQWALVCWETGGALYLKRTPANETLIKRFGYLVLRPSFNRFDYLDGEIKKGNALLEAIEHDISLNPFLQEAYLAKAYTAYYLGMRQTALTATMTALGILPDTAFEHISMAQLLIEMAEVDSARKELRHALRLEPHNSTARELLRSIE